MLVLDCPDMNANDEVHVLGYRIESESPRLDNGLAMEYSEGARHNDSASQKIPAGAAEEKAARVFDHLETFETAGGQAHLRYLPLPDPATIQDANNPSTR